MSLIFCNIFFLFYFILFYFRKRTASEEAPTNRKKVQVRFLFNIWGRTFIIPLFKGFLSTLVFPQLIVNFRGEELLWNEDIFETLICFTRGKDCLSRIWHNVWEFSVSCYSTLLFIKHFSCFGMSATVRFFVDERSSGILNYKYEAGVFLKTSSTCI